MSSESIEEFSSSEDSMSQDGQVAASQPWSEQLGAIPEEDEESEESDDEIVVLSDKELPEVLRQLINVSGIRLIATPDSTWNVDGYAAKLRRSFSVTFSVDDEISSSDVIEAFLKVGVSVEHIYSIQYRNSNRSWCVTFTDELTKEQVLEKGVIRIANAPVFVGDAAFKTVIVKVYEAAPEMPDTVLIGRLSHCGRVLSFRRDRSIATGILNGVRTVRMRLSKTIPSAIRIAGESVFISYPGQPKSCRKCGDLGHLAQGCKNPRCYNCEAPGHRSSECKVASLCGICMKADHPTSECPFLLYSANVANAEDQFVSYADVAKGDRSTTAASTRPRSSEASRGKETGKGSSSKESPGDGQSTPHPDQTDKSSDASRARKRSREESPADDPEKNSDSSKSKRDRDERDRDRDRDRERDRDRDRDRERDRERDRDRDRERDRERERERDRESYYESHRDRDDRRSRDWSHSRDRGRDRRYDDRRDYDRDRDYHWRRDYSPRREDNDYDDRRRRSR